MRFVRLAGALSTEPSNIRTLLQLHIAQGDLPSPTPDTIYVLYVPSTSKVQVPTLGTSCVEFAGEHYWMQATPGDGGAPVTAEYAVVPLCNLGTGVAYWAAHEMIVSWS